MSMLTTLLLNDALSKGGPGSGPHSSDLKEHVDPVKENGKVLESHGFKQTKITPEKDYAHYKHSDGRSARVMFNNFWSVRTPGTHAEVGVGKEALASHLGKGK